MQTVQVVGKLVDKDGNPMEGEILFVPSRFWYTVGTKHYALLAPRVHLFDGNFKVRLTCVERLRRDMYYRVHMPIGEVAIRPGYSEKPLQLTALVKKAVT